MSAMLEVAANGEILYCIACNIYDRRIGIHVPSLEYYHARDQADARIKYTIQYPNRRTHVIVGIAPVIGWRYAGQDKSGEVVKDLAVA
jgi:hypothetical protein